VALTVTSRGSGARNTGSESTYALSPASNFTAGAMAVLCVAYDNSGSSGADPYSSIADSHGNTWTPRINSLIDPGAANAGQALRIFTCAQNVTTLTTGSTITVTFSAVTVSRSYTLYEIKGSVGTPTYVTGGQETAATATPTITTGSITNGYAVIAAIGREGNGTRTSDGDTTNGTWSNAQNNGVGSTTGGSEIISESKVVSATATQTYNPTFGGTSRDGCEAYIVIREAEDHTSTITLKDKALDSLAISAATTETHKSDITIKAIALDSLVPSAAKTENAFTNLLLATTSLSANAITATTAEASYSDLELKAINLDSYAVTATKTENNFSSIQNKDNSLSGVVVAAQTTENHYSAIENKDNSVSSLAVSAETTEGASHISALPIKLVVLDSYAITAYTTEAHKSLIPLQVVELQSYAITAENADSQVCNIAVSSFDLSCFNISAFNTESNFTNISKRELSLLGYAPSTPIGQLYPSENIRAKKQQTELIAERESELKVDYTKIIQATKTKNTFKSGLRKWTL
jgi:hypothetical protein